MPNDQTAPAEKQYTPEENAAAAAKWRELCEGVRHCLDDTTNGFGSIWGGDDNLSAQVQSQYKGNINIEVRLHYTVRSEDWSDLNAANKHRED